MILKGQERATYGKASAPEEGVRNHDTIGYLRCRMDLMSILLLLPQAS